MYLLIARRHVERIAQALLGYLVLAERLRRLGPPHESLDGAWIVLDREARVGETLLKEKDLEAIRGNQRRSEAIRGY